MVGPKTKPNRPLMIGLGLVYSQSVLTRGTSPTAYCTCVHFPLPMENIHASLAASRCFSASSVYLHRHACRCIPGAENT